MPRNKTGKAAKVGTEKIEREKGFLYYLGKDGFVEKAPMEKRKPKPAGEKKAAKKKAAKKPAAKKPKAKKAAPKKK